MQEEIKLLNEKLDHLENGNRRLDGLYYERGERIQKLENELDTCQNQNSGNQVLERMIEGNVKNLFLELLFPTKPNINMIFLTLKRLEI